MKYRYDAFISYRHTELDKFAAENLHRQMEAFRLPGKLSGRTEGRIRINRVFRDRDELPLTNCLEDNITEALRLLEQGDRIQAIETAACALTEYEGMALPYTAEAQYALTESLHAYDNSSYIKTQRQLKTAGVIYNMALSPDCEWEERRAVCSFYLYAGRIAC